MRGGGRRAVGHGVDPTTGEWVTTGDTPPGEKKPAPRAVFLKRGGGIFATGGVELALPHQKRPNHHLVGPHDQAKHKDNNARQPSSM